MVSTKPAKTQTVRCPVCELGMLTTPSVTVRMATTKRFVLPLKVCRICQIVILHEKTWTSGWKIWNMKEYVNRPD